MKQIHKVAVLTEASKPCEVEDRSYRACAQKTSHHYRSKEQRKQCQADAHDEAIGPHTNVALWPVSCVKPDANGDTGCPQPACMREGDQRRPPARRGGGQTYHRANAKAVEMRQSEGVDQIRRIRPEQNTTQGRAGKQ